ncbi:hypothetical protein FRB93_012693 [Tulasnella sp. JGI-2019a]|nr:hypothetical protein FRB93_012693 [Tulasnella sp. JGI-2019a]
MMKLDRLITRQQSGPVIPQQRNPPPPLCQLPTELLFVVGETLESEDLQRLLRVCRIMRPVAEAHLYQHIVISWFYRHRITPLLRTLRDRQDLAAMVRSFQGYLTPHFQTSDLSQQDLGRNGISIEEQISNFGALMDEVLHSMRNLRKLSVYDLALSMPSESVRLLRNVAQKVSLTYLGTGNPDDGLYFQAQREETPVAHEILFFLRQQPLLQHLTLSQNHQSLAGQHLLASDIPCLRSIRGMASDITEIVPGRPVTTLDVCEIESKPTTELWAKLHTSTAPISKITLRIVHKDQLERNLKGMVEHLTQLRSLTLIGVRGDEDYAITSANVRLFANLRDLTMNLTYASRLPEFDVWDDLHASCPNLEWVSITRECAYYPSCCLITCDSELLTSITDLSTICGAVAESELAP